jgi:hypothetical protein
MTILGAMSLNGMVATMTIEEPTDSDIFLAYIEHLLCPVLKPGDVVVMDNLSAHKAQAVREWIENAGAELLYLPPYSPDLHLSRRPGQNSNNCSARPRHEAKKHSIRPSPKLCNISRPATHRLGSGSLSTVYSKTENALATALSTVEAVSITTGSRLAIVVPCGVLLLTTLFFYWRAKDLPADVGLNPINPQISPMTNTSGWKQILRNPEIQLLAAMYFFLKLTRYSLLFWLPLYIVETQSSHGGSALTLSSLFELTGFLGAVCASYASERWFGARRSGGSSHAIYGCVCLPPASPRQYLGNCIDWHQHLPNRDPNLRPRCLNGICGGGRSGIT